MVGNFLAQNKKNLLVSNLKKLSNLCFQNIRYTGYIEASKHQEHTFLLGDRPGLASIFNLPTSSSQLPCRTKAKTRTKDQIYKKPNNQNNNPIPYSPTKSAVNLSSHSLTQNEAMLLSKGLTFTSTLKPDLFSLAKMYYSSQETSRSNTTCTNILDLSKTCPNLMTVSWNWNPI